MKQSRVASTGLSALSAEVIAGSTGTGLTAAGTTTADALELVYDNSYIGTAAAGTGVRLLAGEAGQTAWIYNGGANLVLVYPPTGGTINDGSTDAGLGLDANKAMLIKFKTATAVTAIADDITPALLTVDAIAGGDSSLGITGQAAAQGGAVAIVGGTSSTSANAGGAVTRTGGTGGATGVGGAITDTGGPGQNVAAGGTGTAGGAISYTSGAGGTTATGTGGASGTVTLASGAGGAATGAGTGGAGATVSITGGVGGATTTSTGGAGADIAITAGNGGAASGAGTGGAGGSLIITPGTGGTTSGGTAGKDGVIIERGVKLVKQGAPSAKTTSATLTAVEVLAGIITVNQAAAGASAQQLPLATDMDAALPDSAAGDAFDFSVINTSTVDAEDASVTTNTGWTLVGSMDIHAYSAAGSLNSSGRFRARKTGAGAWTLYRIA